MERFFKLDETYTVLARSENTRYGFRHLASLFKDGYVVGKAKVCYSNRTWEAYEYESVIEKLLERNFKGEQKAKYLAACKARGLGEVDKAFAPVKALVALAEVFGSTEKEKNALKKQALSAVPGIEFPDDFDSLPEEEKKRRLDGAANVLKRREG